MLWLNPVALVALAAVAAPALIHILVHRHAEQFPFPTLRFLRPTRLAAIRRQMLDDLPLLAVRAALIAAAVAALAGPLLVTRARMETWDRRVARARITHAGLERAANSAGAAARPLQRTFEAVVLSDAIRRAILWLETAPPARREIVIASPLPIGSITAADIAAIPAAIGVRFERIGALPRERTVAAGRVLTSTGARSLDLTLIGNQTVVRDNASGDATAWPVDVVSSTDDRPAIDAAIAAVISRRVWAAPPDRRARVMVAGVQAFPPGVVAELSSASAIDRVWMADAVARAAADADLRAAAARVAAGLADPRFSSSPWQTLAVADDGRPLAAAARSSETLLIASAAPAASLATPLLLRSVANGIVDRPPLDRQEVVPIADVVLQRWSRPPAPLTSPRLETVDQDDRRWLWAAALALLIFETWIRRPRPADVPQAAEGEQTRVA
jgi:hypothetical protein